MTALPPRPLRLAATPRTADILRRCYRGERPTEVLERALRMLAQADGHLTPDGRIRTAREAAR
ncbi:hypothetical protein OG244_28320 [Streptomyces brevispora]|uniref:hypothetical protein n=1 Tax=Streptomyces brevispora TaxID=887462 RepID=UPI002E32C47A|nr:hypothetical protein [Streptomyces brevispora]